MHLKVCKAVTLVDVRKKKGGWGWTEKERRGQIEHLDVVTRVMPLKGLDRRNRANQRKEEKPMPRDGREVKGSGQRG